MIPVSLVFFSVILEGILGFELGVLHFMRPGGYACRSYSIDFSDVTMVE